MLLETRSGPFSITNPTANITVASVTNPVPTLTMPSGDGVLSSGLPDGGYAPNGLLLVPYGAGIATNTFTMKVYGWRYTTGLGTGRRLWVPYMLASFTCTLATPPGLSGADVNASQLFCDTIGLVVGNANISNEIVSPGSNAIAHIVLGVKGATLVEVRFGTGSSATSCNALAATM